MVKAFEAKTALKTAQQVRFSIMSITNIVKEDQEQQSILAQTAKCNLGKTQLSTENFRQHINQNEIVATTTSAPQECEMPVRYCPRWK